MVAMDGKQRRGVIATLAVRPLTLVLSCVRDARRARFSSVRDARGKRVQYRQRRHGALELVC